MINNHVATTVDDQDDWMIYLQIIDHRCKGKLNMARMRNGRNLHTQGRSKR